MSDDLPVYNNDNPYYSLENFLIKINFVMTDVKDEDQLGEIIHEYTHYLQSLTTVNGLSTLTVYLDLIIKITVDIYGSIVNNKFDTKTIISNYKDDFGRLANKISWERKPIDLNIKRKKPFYITKKLHNPLVKKQVDEVFIYNIQDDLIYHISTSVLRENMAMMAYFHSHGIGQDAVMDYVNLHKYKCKYWIVFNYFLYNYPKIRNVVVFTYYFCELALMDLLPSLFMYELLIEIDKLLSNHQYNDEDTFFQLLFSKFQNRVKNSFQTINNVIFGIKKKLEVLKFHDFYLSIQKMIELCERGINYRQYNGTLFRQILDGRWINYMSKNFLSPLIVQPSKKFSILGDEKNYTNLIGLLFGVANVIRLFIQNENIGCCPFYEDIPICSLYKDDRKIENICISNPTEILCFPEGGCIFYNTCLVLGLLPPNEYKKYSE